MSPQRLAAMIAAGRAIRRGINKSVPPLHLRATLVTNRKKTRYSVRVRRENDDDKSLYAQIILDYGTLQGSRRETVTATLTTPIDQGLTSFLIEEKVIPWMDEGLEFISEKVFGESRIRSYNVPHSLYDNEDHR